MFTSLSQDQLYRMQQDADQQSQRINFFIEKELNELKEQAKDL